MAVIAPFLQRQLYDEAVTEMADELRHKVDLLESTDSDVSDHHANGTRRHKWDLPKAGDDASQVLVPKRSDAEVLRRRSRAGPPSGPDKVSNWLLGSKDWSRQFMRSHGGPNSPIVRRPRHSTGILVPGPGYGSIPTRHKVPYDHFSNWWLRFNLRGRLDKALPVVAPNTRGRTAWDIFILVLVLYSAVTVPLAFSYGLPQSSALVATEWLLTAAYVIDLAVNFRTAYFDDDGNMVRDSWPVARRYLTTWFISDFLATVPFDGIAVMAGVGGNQSQLMVLAFLKTPRLLRLFKLMRLLDRMRNANLIKVLQLILLMMMIAHWLACIWYVIARYAPGDEDWGFNTLDDENRLTWYLSAFYYSFLLLIGDNIQAMNNYERLFFILALVAGACFYSAVVGNMALLVANMNTVAVRFRQKLDMTQDALRYMRVPEMQRERVQAFYDFITQFSHPGSEGLGVLSELTKGINEDLHIFLHSSTLKKIYLFKDCEHAFIRSLSMRMKIVTFIPGEVIFRQGDLGHEMYIIRAGCVAVVSKNNEVMSLLQAGDFFGEIALLTQSRRTAKCIALSNCDLAILNSFDIKVLMKEFPRSASSLQVAARDRLRQLQIAGRAGTSVSPDGDEDGDEDEEQKQREEVRRQRRSEIARFTTGRGLQHSKAQVIETDDPSSGAAGGGKGASPCLPPVSAPFFREQGAWAVATPGAAAAEKRVCSGGGAAARPSEGLDSNLPPASYIESSRNSYASLATEDSAREFVTRRHSNSMTSQGGPSTGPSASPSGSYSRRTSCAGAGVPAAAAAGANAPGISRTDTAAGVADRLRCLTAEPNGAAAELRCDKRVGAGGVGGGGNAETPLVGVAFANSLPQIRSLAIEGELRSRSSPSTPHHPAPTNGSGNGTSNPPQKSAPQSSSAARNGPSSSSWSALFTRRPGMRAGAASTSPQWGRSRTSTAEGATTAAAEGTSAAGASGADAALLDTMTRFDFVEKFQPSGPKSSPAPSTAARSSGALSDGLPKGRRRGCNSPLAGQSPRAGPMAEAVEQVLSPCMQTARVRPAAGAADGAGASMPGAAEGTAPGSRDLRSLQSPVSSRRTSTANAIEARTLLSSPVKVPCRRDRRTSLVLPYSNNSTNEFAAAVAAAMGIASPLPDGVRAGGGSGNGYVRPTGSTFANALAATVASMTPNGAARGSTPDNSAQGGQTPVPGSDIELQQPPAVHPRSSGMFSPFRGSNMDIGIAAALADGIMVRAADGSPHSNAQGPYGMMRSAAARRADAMFPTLDSPICMRNMAEGYAGVPSPTYRLSPSLTIGNVAAAGKLLPGRTLNSEDSNGTEAFSYSLFEGAARRLKAVGSTDLSQLAPPGYEEAYTEGGSCGVGGAGDANGSAALRSSGSGAFGTAERLTRSYHIKTIRRSIQGTEPQQDAHNAAAQEEVETVRRDDCSGAPNVPPATTAVASEDGGDESLSPVMEWISTSRASTAKARRQRRQSSVGTYSPQSRQNLLGAPSTLLPSSGSGANGNLRLSSQLAELQRTEAEHNRREVELARREADLERREAEVAVRQAEAMAALAEATQKREETAGAFDRIQSVHVMLLVLAGALAELAFKVEHLEAQLGDTDAAVGRIEAQHGQGRTHGNEFLGLGQTPLSLPVVPGRDRDARAGLLERNGSLERRTAAMERNRTHGNPAGSSTRRASALMHGGAMGGNVLSSLLHSGDFLSSGKVLPSEGVGSGDVSVSGRRLATYVSSISGVDNRDTAVAAGGSKTRRTSALRMDSFMAGASQPTEPGRVVSSFTVAMGHAGHIRDSMPPSPSAGGRMAAAASFTAGVHGSGPAATGAPPPSGGLLLFSAALGGSFRKGRSGSLRLQQTPLAASAGTRSASSAAQVENLAFLTQKSFTANLSEIEES